MQLKVGDSHSSKRYILLFYVMFEMDVYVKSELIPAKEMIIIIVIVSNNDLTKEA